MVGPKPQETPASSRPIQTAASIILGSLAILIFGVQPVLYAALVNEGLIQPDRLGLLSAAEVTAIAIGSGLAITALKQASSRTVAALAIAIILAANAMQAYHITADTLFALRMLTGLGSGFLVGVAGTAIAASSRVGQWAAFYLLAQATSQFLHLQWFSVFRPAATSADILLSLAFVSACMIAGVPLLPRHVRENAPVTTGAEDRRASPDALGVRWLLAMFLFVGGVLTIWAYAGVWLESEKVNAQAAAGILSTSLAGQALGALAACFIPSSRHDRLRWASTTLLLLISTGMWLKQPGSAVAAAGFGIWWLASVPVLSSILSEVDPKRNALPFAPAAQLAGVAIIPTFAGILFAAQNVKLVLVSGCLAIALSLLLGLASSPRRSTHG